MKYSLREIFSLERVNVNPRISDFYISIRYISIPENIQPIGEWGVAAIPKILIGPVVYGFSDALKASGRCGEEKRIQYRICSHLPVVTSGVAA